MNNNYFTQTTVYQNNYAMLSFELIDNPKYNKLSNDAKIAYALLVSRTFLSIQNHFLQGGKAYVFFPREEMMTKLNCSEKKAVAVFKELRTVDLIEEVRQGFKKANIIFVKMPEASVVDVEKSKIKSEKKATSLQKKKEFLKKLNTSLKVKNNLLQKLNAVISGTKKSLLEEHTNSPSVTSDIINSVKSQIEYDYFIENDFHVSTVDSIVTAVAEMQISKQTKINNVYYSKDELSPTLAKINDLVVLEFIEHFSSKAMNNIKNLRAYIKTAIFNFVHEREMKIDGLFSCKNISADGFAGYDLDFLDDYWNTVPSLA